jgi:acetyl esterase/lipase
MDLFASTLFLLVSLWGAWFTYNAYRPVMSHRHLSVVSFFAGWFTTELALHHIIWQAVCTAGFIWLGALRAWPGQIGLAITIVSWFGLAGCLLSGRRAAHTVEQALRAALPQGEVERLLSESTSLDPIDRQQVLLPFPIRKAGVERIRDIVYSRVAGLDLKLDIYRGAEAPNNCPVVLQIHGGAWIVGTKNEQGIPLIHKLARRGWVCVSADYRLSPGATFPDHLIDIKRAIAWIREHIAEYGGDPERLVVTGGSAGGHLSSLVALTANDSRYQPGFESVDTSVLACVPFYGVYDFTNRHGTFQHGGLAEILEQQVMKASLDEDREAYELASPLSRIHADAPPFMVLHGNRDTLAPVEDARHFCEKFRATCKSPIVYAELPGAQHAFELFPSLRAAAALTGVAHFLDWVLEQRDRRAASAPEARKAG